MNPFMIASLALQGGNLLSSLFAPSQAKLTAASLRRAMETAKRAGFQRIQAGVAGANRAGAAQAAQAGVASPNYLTRITGLNELAGGQQEAQLTADLEGQLVNQEMSLSGMNLQAGQRKAGMIGDSLSTLADPIGQFGILKYLTQNPQLLSMIQGRIQ